MKKIIALLLLVLSLACLAGCSKTTECEICGETTKCKKVTISYDGEDETGYVCSDCLPTLKELCAEVEGCTIK